MLVEESSERFQKRCFHLLSNRDLEEILSLALREIKRTEYADMLGAGVVLTGGGSLMDGIQELSEKVFEMPVKLGIPTGFGGLTEAAKSPVHATGVGFACMVWNR